MTLKAVSGGWINTDFENMEEERSTMITQERKSKYKHKITMPREYHWVPREHEHTAEMRDWCEKSYGPGGRKSRWRFGWTQKDATFYFRSSKDAMLFTLRWAS